MTITNRITENDITTFSEHPTLSAYQRIATKSAIYPGQGTALGLTYVGLKLNGEAGEFAEHVGKAVRDDDLIKHKGRDEFFSGELTPERHALLIKEAGDVLWYLSAACNELGIDLAEVAYTSLRKLLDRTNRGKLRGSGDER